MKLKIKIKIKMKDLNKYKLVAKYINIYEKLKKGV